MAAATPTRRAPGVLVYVPGLGQDSLNRAEVVAASIARTASLSRGKVEAISETPPAPRGLRAVRTICVDQVRVLDIVELDYRDAMESLDRDRGDGREAVPPGLLQTAFYTAKGVWLGIRALRRRGKSGKAMANLAVGTLLMLVLVLAFALTLLGVALAVLTATPLGESLPEWMDPSAQTLMVFGLVSGTAYLAFRRNILRGAQRIRQLLRYLDEPAAAKEVTDRLTYAIDAIIDEGAYTGSIHVLAYSFGSIVVLDDLAPPTGTNLTNTQRVTSAISSVVTVGCPFDFIAQYQPKYFADRTARRPDLPWRNIFIASDVFGSNFVIGNDDTTAQDQATPLGWSVADSIRYLPAERLTVGGVFKLAGLRQHTTYWSASGGCWDSVIDLWGFALPAAPGPAPQEAIAADPT